MTELRNPVTPSDAEKIREAIRLVSGLSDSKVAATLVALLSIRLVQRLPLQHDQKRT